MKTLAKLEKLSKEDLKTYLDSRYSLQELDPPLAPLGEESPHAFVLECDRLSEDEGFKKRLRQVHAELLDEWRTARAAEGPPYAEEKQEYLRLVILAIDSLKPAPAYSILADLIAAHGSTKARQAVFEASLERQILVALARIQPEGALVHFWKSLWENGNSDFSNEVFFGLERANLEEALRELPRAMERSKQGPNVIERSGLAWRLIRKAGARRLVESLAPSPNLLSSVREALVQAGAGEDLLGEFAQAQEGLKPPIPTKGKVREFVEEFLSDLIPQLSPSQEASHRQMLRWAA